jgi:hypothetical protein
MGNDKYWAGNIEMQLACYIFGIKLAIYQTEQNEASDKENSIEIIEDDDEEIYHFINIISISNYKNDKIPIMILNYLNKNHYELLYFKNKIESYKDLNINKENYKKNININNFSKKENISYYKKVYNSSDKKTKFRLSLIKENNNKKDKNINNIDINNNNKSEYLHNINPYPKYTSGDDPNLYYNIYNFLKNGLVKNERCWPTYIKDINKTKKGYKNLIFIEK